MTDIALNIEKLSKSYRIGSRLDHHQTLRDRIANIFKNPFQGRNASGTDENWIWALKDFSCEIKQGEVVGIIGRNGAGKSTLLKIISRITEPTQGRVRVWGRVGSLLEVGTGFHPELTGRENIYLNAAILGMKKREIEQKFDEIVAFSEIGKFLDTPVKHYSSGMYVRLAFAVAAHLDPEILLVDEVLAVGDVLFQKKCLGRMGNVAKEGRTVLFVSHNLEAVLALCHKGIYLNGGQLAASGDIQSVVDHYLKDTLSERTSQINVSNHARDIGLAASPFQILELKFLTDNKDLIYKIGERLQLEMTYELKSPVDGLRIGLAINTLLNQRLSTFHTPLEESMINVGKNKILLQVDTSQLKPGTYMIDVGARSGKKAYDHLIGVGSFEISPLTYGGEPHDDDNAGLISLRHEWSK